MLDIKVLGPGCINCEKLYNLCSEVITENNIEAKLEKVVNREDFLKYGIMLTPALVVNDKVLIQGKIPTKATLENWLKNFLG